MDILSIIWYLYFKIKVVLIFIINTTLEPHSSFIERKPNLYRILAIVQNPVRAKNIRFKPIMAVKISQPLPKKYTKTALEKVKNPATNQITRSKYHFFVLAQYIQITPVQKIQNTIEVQLLRSTQLLPQHQTSSL